MTTNTHEDNLPTDPAATHGDLPPARKRATRKTALKTTANLSLAPLKTAAKKTTKKATAKSAAAPGVAIIEATAAAEPKTKKPRTKKAAPAAAPAPDPGHPQHARQDDPPAEEQKRFGRVPGGGPTASREAPAPHPPAEAPAPVYQESPPQPPPPPDRQPQGQPNRNFQNRDGQNRDGQNRDGQNRDGQNRDGQVSRSKRRREKRKNRQNQGHGERHGQGKVADAPRPEPGDSPGGDANERRPVPMVGPKIETNGMLELAPKGFGFLRVPAKHFEQIRDDVFVTPESIRRYNLRLGQWIHGLYQEGARGPQLVEITAVNGMPPEDAAKLPHFDELKAINPTRRISFETTPERFTTRVVDIMAPVGRGQRGLIVSPPRSGKTTLLLHMAEAIRLKYEDSIHLMVLLVDERPEEVTEFRRALPGAEIYASSNDEQARNHCRIAELAIERAKRLVEAGKDVFMVMDSITRLARAYNNTMNNRGRGTGSGGITIGALEVPRRLFAAARNTRGGGSLTILATALIQTNSRADEAIFMEFKGTGNMELVLDRKIAENYIYPAVDIFKSGTRREEILIPEHMLHKIHLIRRGLSGHRPAEAMERLLFFLKKFPNNPQMLLEIKG
jgi:transcription termination factor Rho